MYIFLCTYRFTHKYRLVCHCVERAGNCSCITRYTTIYTCLIAHNSATRALSLSFYCLWLGSCLGGCDYYFFFLSVANLMNKFVKL